MTLEEKAKAYDEAVNKLRRFMAQGVEPLITRADVQDFFPELKETEDERIRKAQLDYWRSVGGKEWHGVPVQESIAWLEKQGNTAKEITCTQEVEVGNGNIKALVTEKLDSTNTNTEDDVRRRSTIRVLEYARGLDTYNQFGKADIDKNIAWLEKQCKPMWTDEDEELLQHCCGAVAAADYYTFEDKEEMTNWLVSLKQRIGG